MFGKRSVSEARDKSPIGAATVAVAAKPIGYPGYSERPAGAATGPGAAAFRRLLRHRKA